MIYGRAAAMGWTAAETDKASLWAFQAAYAGWRASHCADPDDEGLTDDEFAGLGAVLDSFDPAQAGAPN